jgi:hypothetical protein
MSIGYENVENNSYWIGLDYTPPPAGGFYHDYGMAFLASFDVSSLHLDYCTGWGQGSTLMYMQDLVSVGYGLDYDGTYLWMVGGTHALTLTDADCPDPGGTGVYHTHVNSGGGDVSSKCDGFILAFDPETYELKYGTLLGGYGYDMLLDVGHDASNIYITGETRSNTHYTTDLDPDRYFQPLNPNGTSRDAVVLALQDNLASPTLLWQTAFGGTGSERGWGIAATQTEVYLTGATASAAWESYPLKEFNPESDLDFYQDLNFGGDAYSFLDYYQFEYGLDGEQSTSTTNPEPAQQPHDGFIASFNSLYHGHVGIPEAAARAPGLSVLPLPMLGQWTVHFPGAGDWTLIAYNSAGQQVGLWHSSSPSLVADLTAQPHGMYLLLATTLTGARYSAKVVRP